MGKPRGLFKIFQVTERRAFELRAQAFKVANHNNGPAISGAAGCFAGPSVSAGDQSYLLCSTFLHPTAARDSRIIQLGLKFAF